MQSSDGWADDQQHARFEPYRALALRELERRTSAVAVVAPSTSVNDFSLTLTDLSWT